VKPKKHTPPILDRELEEPGEVGLAGALAALAKIPDNLARLARAYPAPELAAAIPVVHVDDAREVATFKGCDECAENPYVIARIRVGEQLGKWWKYCRPHAEQLDDRGELADARRVRT
jgi:gamma-glutamyl:cysteine ligase YbdK (ATP-grasp superfamily)